MAFSTLGAVAGLVLAVALILRKTPPAYALVFGALVGGLLGGGSMAQTVNAMVSGSKDMMPSVLRILTSGVLAGALIRTGSAERLAGAIVNALGRRFAVAAVALATLVVCAVGVFVDISVITVAPIALAVGRRAGVPVSALLVAMVGGGKAGNVISPNPNTIAVAEAFKLDLTSVMAANLVPAACAFLMAAVLSSWLARKGNLREAESAIRGEAERDGRGTALPSLCAALAGPVVVIGLLSLRPLCGVAVDPLVALPAGGLVSIVACGRFRETLPFVEFGLSKVVGVSILLVGTGTVAGVVKASALQGDVLTLLDACHLPAFALAPLSSVLMSGVTASTTAGVTIASQTFSGALTAAGVPALSAAAMLHAGGTIFDALPHGSFFHATAGAVGMGFKERLRLFPYGTLVGATSTVASVVCYLLSRA